MAKKNQIDYVRIILNNNILMIMKVKVQKIKKKVMINRNIGNRFMIEKNK